MQQIIDIRSSYPNHLNQINDSLVYYSDTLLYCINHSSLQTAFLNSISYAKLSIFLKVFYIIYLPNYLWSFPTSVYVYNIFIHEYAPTLFYSHSHLHLLPHYLWLIFTLLLHLCHRSLGLLKIEIQRIGCQCSQGPCRSSNRRTVFLSGTY